MLNALVAYAAEEGAPEHNPLIPAWYDIIWSLVCFVIILFLFWRVALPRMKKLLDGLRLEIAVDVLGTIVKTNSPHVQGSRVTLLDFGLALADATRHATLAEAEAEARRVFGGPLDWQSP